MISQDEITLISVSTRQKSATVCHGCTSRLTKKENLSCLVITQLFKISQDEITLITLIDEKAFPSGGELANGSPVDSLAGDRVSGG